MLSFLSRLFGNRSGGKPGNSNASVVGEAVEYQGFTIHPAPQPDNGQWRLAGEIAKGAGEERQSRRFVRADTFSSREEAENFSVRKARQIIDERGEKLFHDEAGNL